MKFNRTLWNGVMRRNTVTAALLVWLSLHVHGMASDLPLELYFNQQTENGKSRFPGINSRQTLSFRDGERSLDIYLVVGDVTDFIGPTRTKTVIDAMLVSTNVDLDFEAANPTIQATIRRTIPSDIQERIRDAFREKRKEFGRRFRTTRPRPEFLFPVLKECISSGTSTEFTPKQFHFVSTDKSRESTMGNKEWQDLKLSRVNISRGVRAALDQAVTVDSNCRTFVAGLVGSSKVSFQKTYLLNENLRGMLVARSVKSVGGILTGIGKHLVKQDLRTPIREIAVIVWDEDIIKIADPKMSTSQLEDEDDAPGGYRHFEKSVEREFETSVDQLRQQLNLM